MIFSYRNIETLETKNVCKSVVQKQLCVWSRYLFYHFDFKTQIHEFFFGLLCSSPKNECSIPKPNIFLNQFTPIFIYFCLILSHSKSVHWPEISQEEESEFFKGEYELFLMLLIKKSKVR